MSNRRKLVRRGAPIVGLAAVMAAGLITPAGASSHREAPMITEDPAVDLTDVYAFVSPDKPDTVTLIANVNPFEEPAGGPNFHKFADAAMYEIHVDSDGNAAPDKTYQFKFDTRVANGKTFLYNTNQVTGLADPDLNVRQSYSVTEIDRTKGAPKTKVLASNVPVAPANVGPRSTPNYETNLGQAAVTSIGNGITTFAGPRDDPFFVDLGSIFDLGGLRPFNAAHLIPLPAEAGKDYVAGHNVHSIAIQIPISRLVENGDPVIGVWATTSRYKTTVLQGAGKVALTGPFVQVSRLGMPLVNEVVIPIGMKDRFNGSSPTGDLQFAASVLNPELANLIPVLYPGVTVPTNVDAGLGLGGREDIATIFLTGIPGVNKPANVKPSEMIRLNTSTASSFPNGRTLTDDVTDIELRALAGATAFTPAFNISPNKDLADGVNANDLAFTATFPYLASPHQGY